LNNEHHIKYLGPAFFTKFLYFASSDSDQRALILDARLAAAVRRLSGSNSVPGSAAWRTPKYALYMAYMDKVAAAVNRRRPRSQRVTTGQVELALFRQSA
jgi:hypothetical protein